MKPLHILIVEDNPINQMITGAMLRAIGVTSSVAGDVKEAWQQLDGKSYDVILMDSQLPDGSGVGLTGDYIAKGGKIPVIAMTGMVVPKEHRESCLAAGMVDYLQKPFTLQQLKEVLTRHTSNEYS